MIRLMKKINFNTFLPSTRNKEAHCKSRTYDHNDKGVYDLPFQLRYMKPLADANTTARLLERAPWLR